jgi:hypothetical protein
MQFLVSELAAEEDVPLLDSETAYPIWTPYDSYEAAAGLIEFLKEEQITYAD